MDSNVFTFFAGPVQAAGHSYNNIESHREHNISYSCSLHPVNGLKPKATFTRQYFGKYYALVFISQNQEWNLHRQKL